MAFVRGIKLGLTGLTLAAALFSGLAGAKAPTDSPGRGASISISEIPFPGTQTYELIARGGPFPSEKDAAVFGNRERLLPIKRRGYYREYTVKTPGLNHRGSRRIICGGEPMKPDVCYYTADHYASFRMIVR
ncbi:MAG: ribonuclease domain-containing protein [Betaproteobacteria bacterium]